MTPEHEIDKEALSAYLDGELAAREAAAVETHLASCRRCSGYLARIRGASAEFKRSRPKAPASSPAPARPGVRAAVVILRIGAGAAAVVGFLLITGIFVKWSLPGLFSQVQGMISGAANTMGSGQ